MAWLRRGETHSFRRKVERNTERVKNRNEGADEKHERERTGGNNTQYLTGPPLLIQRLLKSPPNLSASSLIEHLGLHLLFPCLSNKPDLSFLPSRSVPPAPVSLFLCLNWPTDSSSSPSADMLQVRRKEIQWQFNNTELTALSSTLFHQGVLHRDVLSEWDSAWAARPHSSWLHPQLPSDEICQAGHPCDPQRLAHRVYDHEQPPRY